MPCQAKCRSLSYLSVLVLAILCAAQAAAEESVLFYASFDEGVNADKAAGNGTGVFNGHPARLDFQQQGKGSPDPLLQFAPGIRGKGLLTGVNGQGVYYQAPGNIDPAAWTITFWVKGLDGKNYLEAKRGHQELFEMFGDGWTRFYKYQGQGYLRFLITKKGPHHKDIVQNLNLKGKMDTGRWHFFSITYEKASGVSIYVDGRLTERDSSMEPVQKPVWFRVGQFFGGDREPNRIIDEFRIYSGAMTGRAIVRRYLQEKNWSARQYALVLKSTGKMVIDGKLDEAEWENACVISGFIDMGQLSVAETQTRAYLTYDDSFLYLAFQSDIPEKARNAPEMRLLHGILKRTKLQHDVNVDADDSFGVYLIPRYPKGNTYRLFVNGMETKYEYSISPGGEIRLKWDPQWKVKSHISMSGWTVEARVPLRDLGIDRIQDGEKWKFQFFRNWRLLKKETDAWAVFSGPKKERSDGFGTIVFAGKEGVAVRLEEFARQESGGLRMAVELRNRSRRPAAVTASLRAGDKALASRELAIEAGERAKFKIDADLAEVTANVLHFAVRDKTGRLLYSQDIPYSVPEKLGLTLKKYPSNRLLAVTWRLRGLHATADTLRALVEIVSKRNGKPVFTQSISPIPALNGAAKLSTSAIPPGKYEVRMTIVHQQKTLVKKIVAYEKKPLPDWFGNRLGLSDEVPPPWTPLEVNRDAVLMWGRRYDFKGKLFPEEIINQGKRILAAPISLACRLSGGEGLSSSDTPARVRWDRRGPLQAVSTRKQDVGSLSITNKSTIEFDGMMWMEITVAPKEAEAAVRELTLSIPMEKKYAHLINAYDYSLRTTGRLPEKGYVSAMGPRWVGDEEGGIQVFAETSANWMVEDKRKELEITTGPERVVIRLHLIDRPVTLTEPVTFALGLIVTPVKKTTPKLRDIFSIGGRWIPLVKGTGFMGTHCKRAFQAHKGLEVYHLWAQGWWETEEGYKGNPDRTGFYPLPRKTLKSSYGERKTDYGMIFRSAPYARLQQTWAASPEFAQFGDEWMSNLNQQYIPNDSLPRAQWAAQVCQNARSFQDFTLYGLNRLLETTKTRAFYFDVSKPHACNNSYHGCGLRTGNGPAAYTTNFLGTRRLLRRIYTLLKQKHPDGLIFFHMSGQVVMPCWSFADALVDGENYASLLDRKNNRGYENVLTLEQFAAEYAAQNNFGPYSIVLPEFERAGAIRGDEWKELGYQHAEYLLGLIFLHNSQLWFPAYIAPEPTGRLYLAFDENGLDSSWKFIGYWKQTAVTLPENLKASFYVSPDRKKAFLLVMNFGTEDKTLNLELNLRALGMQPQSRARMLYPQDTNVAKGSAIKSAHVPAKNFRLYLLQ